MTVIEKSVSAPEATAELRRLARGMGVLLALFLISRGALSLAVLALARFLPVEDFGYLVLARNLVEFAYVLLNLGLPFAFLRFFSEHRDDPARLFRTTGMAMLALNLAGSALLLLFRAPLAQAMGMEPAFQRYLLLVSAICVFQAIGQLILLDYQAREDFRGYMRVQLFLTGLMLAPMAVVGAWMQSGEHALGGMLAGSVVAVLLLIAWVGRRRLTYGSFDPVLAARMLRFGVPLVFTNVAFWIVSFSDRFLLGYFRGIHEVSVYAIPGLICSLLAMVFTMPVNSALAPQVYRLHQDGEGAKVDLLLQTVHKLYLLLVPATLILVVHAAPLAVSLLGRPEYMEGLRALPVLGIGFVFFILYAIPNVVLSQHHRTGIIGITFVAACACNVLLNLFLIPRFGFMGAAWSALISYLVIYAVTSRAAAAYCRFGRAVWLVLPAWAGLFFLQERIRSWTVEPFWLVFFGLLLTAAYLLLLSATRAVRASELRFLWSSLRR